MNLFPMPFIVFLKASGKELLEEKIVNISFANTLPEIVHNKLTDLLKMYLYLGGMPEVVGNYLEKISIYPVEVKCGTNRNLKKFKKLCR